MAHGCKSCGQKNCDCCKSCGCKSDDCDCGCSSCHGDGNAVKLGPATPDFGRFQTVQDEDADIGPLTTQVDVCGDTDVTLTLPKCPVFGRAPLIINNTGNGTVTLVSGDRDIVGQDANGNVFVGAQTSAEVTFGSCGEGCGEWSVLFGGTAEGIQEADYIVVGLGSAGCPLARYLSEDMKTSVIVLEAGLDQSKNPIVTSTANSVGNSTLTPTSGNQPVSQDPALNFFYSLNAGPPITGSPPATDLILPTRFMFPSSGGRMWGGSSAHASLFALRGTPGPYNQWGAINAQWLYNNLLPLMKFTETYTPNATPFDPLQRGASGPVSVVQTPPHQVSTFYTTTSTVLNAPGVPDVNAPPAGNIGLSSLQRYVRTDNVTRSWAQDFLPSTVLTTDADGNGTGVGDRKLKVISRATAVEILFDDTQSPPVAIGVKYFLGGINQMRTVLAKKKVILSAGAMESVKLLQLSGIGPAAVLSKFAIPARVVNENVGRNVQNHFGYSVAIPQAVGSPTPLNEFVFVMWDGSNSVNPNGQANDGIRRLEVITRTASTSLITPQIATAFGMTPANTICMFGILITDTPKNGTIEIVSVDPDVTPLYTPRYYEDVAPPGGKSSLDRIVDFVLAAADISIGYSGGMPTFPPAFMYPNTFPGGTHPPGDTSALRLAIREDFPSPFLENDHCTGACRMATTAATGVVDGNLDVFGVKNLAVCDNSVIPEITDNHTMWPPMILGLQKAKIEGAVGLP